MGYIDIALQKAGNEVDLPVRDLDDPQWHR
jgi:hypothetical protein